MAPKTIRLKNLLRRMRVFNLEHPVFVNAPGANGVGKAEALTMLPLQTMTLPAQVLECVEIKAAMLKHKKGRLPTLRVVG